MGEDFVRCYIISHINNLSPLKAVQLESGKFNEWQLIQGSRFKLKESYGYTERLGQRDEPMLNVIAERSVIAESRQPETTKASLLWKNALNIADVLTLVSIARARHYSTLAVEKSLGDKYNIVWGLMTGEMTGNWDIVSLGDLGRFVSDAMTFIEKNTHWLEESGFIPSLYWYTQAQISWVTAAPSVLEMGLYWVSIEIIAGTYIDSNKLGITNKKERVKRFVNDKGYSSGVWGFLDEVIDDWYAVRNDLFHEGKQNLPFELIVKRRQQVRDFTSLVFVEMLQKQDEARKKEIATRMQNY